MSDQWNVMEAMTRYGRAVDTRDHAVLETCFTEDAVIRYSSTFADDINGRAALAAYLVDAVGPLDATQHLFGSFEVEVTGDQARMRCYVQAMHVLLDAPDGHLFTVGGRYDNTVVRGADGLWRMSLLDFEPMWTGGNPAVLAHTMPEAAATEG